MSLFNDVIKDDAAGFVDPELFGEEVVYEPAGQGAQPRTIRAVVTRGPRVASQFSRGTRPSINVTVRNSVEHGISSAEIKGGADRIRLPNHFGAADASRMILSIVAQDAGMIRLEVG